ncbi:MAG: YtxH domain-containing protein [Candidatus Binatia bacterium]
MRRIDDFLPTREDLASAIGLTSRNRFIDDLMPTVGVFAAGILVGAGLALLFAPRPGNEIREGIGTRFGHLRERVGDEKRGEAAA